MMIMEHQIRAIGHILQDSIPQMINQVTEIKAHAIQNDAFLDEENWVDIRLGCEANGSWEILWGDPQYDQRHYPLCGYVMMSRYSDPSEMVHELIEDLVANAS